MTKGLPISEFFVEFQPEFRLTLEFILFHTEDFSLVHYWYSHLPPSDSSINLIGQLGYLCEIVQALSAAAVGYSNSAKPSGENKRWFFCDNYAKSSKRCSLGSILLGRDVREEEIGLNMGSSAKLSLFGRVFSIKPLEKLLKWRVLCRRWTQLVLACPSAGALIRAAILKTCLYFV